MQDEIVVADGARPLSQGERLIDAFIAPSKTFTDILRDASWWLPYILVSLLGIAFAYVLLHKVGLPALIDGVVHMNASLEDKLSSASPSDAARMRTGIGWQFKAMYGAPIFSVIVSLIVAGILMATSNFVFAGKARYGQVLAVWYYGTLPLIFIYLLTIVTVYAGVGTDSFNIKNTVGTNIGYYLQGGASPHWLVTLLSSVDVFAIWAALLLTIGLSIVAGIKRSSAAIVVFGWWGVWVLGQTLIAAITG